MSDLTFRQKKEKYDQAIRKNDNDLTKKVINLFLPKEVLENAQRLPSGLKDDIIQFHKDQRLRNQLAQQADSISRSRRTEEVSERDFFEELVKCGFDNKLIDKYVEELSEDYYKINFPNGTWLELNFSSQKANFHFDAKTERELDIQNKTLPETIFKLYKNALKMDIIERQKNRKKEHEVTDKDIDKGEKPIERKPLSKEQLDSLDAMTVAFQKSVAPRLKQFIRVQDEASREELSKVIGSLDTIVTYLQNKATEETDPSAKAAFDTYAKILSGMNSGYKQALSWKTKDGEVRKPLSEDQISALDIMATKFHETFTPKLNRFIRINDEASREELSKVLKTIDQMLKKIKEKSSTQTDPSSKAAFDTYAKLLGGMNVRYKKALERYNKSTKKPDEKARREQVKKNNEKKKVDTQPTPEER